MGNRTRSFASPLVLCLCLASIAAAQQPAAQSDAPARPNAALVYWQAFALMPKLSPEQSELLNADPAAPNDKNEKDAFRQLFDHSGDALRLLYVASKMEHCHWQPVQAGPATLFPHLQEARQLSRLVLLRARERAASGNPKGAVADVLASYRLGRHIRGCLVESLVSIAIERQTSDTVRRILRHLKEADCQTLLAGVDSLPQRTTFAESMLAERDLCAGWLLEQARQGNFAERLAKMDAVDVTEATQLLTAAYLNQDALEELVQWFNRIAELSKQPQATEKLPGKNEALPVPRTR
jgi:hypothetical protein